MRIRILSSLLFALIVLLFAGTSHAQVAVGISITVAPPELPVYDQPVCPEDGWIWTPGYWAWDPDAGDYYWVPGTWVAAPEVGFLWTPAWWGWGDGVYAFHEGYWGPQIGFYGGINYGFGYFGQGFEGGRWDNGHFFYNRAVANINVTIIHNVYETRVENTQVTRVSFNGGNGGINARPTPQEEAAGRERHVGPVAAQTQHIQAARGNPELRASANHGKPPIAATAKPGEFKGSGAIAAKEGGTVHEPAARTENNGNRPTENNGARPENNANRPPENNAARPNNPAIHAKDVQPPEHPAAPNTGNPKLDQKYQKQQQSLQAKQDQERQNLQKKQDQDHQKLQQQKANDTQTQQLEQRHQQQTQQLVQKHTQQQQQLQQKQQPAPHAAPSKAPQKP
jgi:hypothetical protein